ncbi:MAG: PRC-barrel domain-containing protein [Syntrophomonadaceae bacterium]|nr:PRC-barrel domain-containing protein [Syntrophomonadaceae bacterium]
MKIRNLENLPVILESSAQEIGKVVKAVIDDDFSLAYLVIDLKEGGPGIIFSRDFWIGKHAVMVSHPDSIKSYAHGEESSIYEKKIGDTLLDKEGRELGVLSDFVINPDSKEVWGVELSAGAFQDILEGRSEFPINSVKWASRKTAMFNQEGSDIS